MSDITYVATDEGWLYLAVVLDLYSRLVVGWAMSERMTAQLVCDALQMALWRRKKPAGVIVHSDRGSQYCSGDYQRLLRNNGLVCSMSKKGDCYDTQFRLALNVRTRLTRATTGRSAFALTCRQDPGVPRALLGQSSVT